MKKVKLTLNELLILDRELNGLVNPQDGTVVFKGVLSHKMGIVAKYRLSKVAQVVNEEKKLFNDLRNDLIKAHADDPEAPNMIVSPTIKDGKKQKENPKYKEFLAEIEKLGNEEREVEFPEIEINDLNFETEEYYNILFEKII